jgi:hypothetical protein
MHVVRKHRSAALVALLLFCVGSGCVQRRMMIRSHPEGALVYLNGQELGRTPITTNFTYYGDFEVKLVKDGFETETIIQPVPMPWYQVPPLDFVSENMVPSKIHDQRTLSFNLRPKVAQSPEQIRAAAEQLRTASRSATAPPLTPAAGEPIPYPSTNTLPLPTQPSLLPPPMVQPLPSQPAGPRFDPGPLNWPTQ